MAETTIPTRADAELPETLVGYDVIPKFRHALAELRITYDLYQRVVKDIRSTGANSVLFELVYYRGMSTDEAGAILGVSGQAIRKRLHPLAVAAGIDGLTWAQRMEADVFRPYRRASDRTLMAVLLEGDRALASYARDLHAQLRDQLNELHERGYSYIDTARFLGVNKMQVFRVVWAKP